MFGSMQACDYAPSKRGNMCYIFKSRNHPGYCIRYSSHTVRENGSTVWRCAFCVSAKYKNKELGPAAAVREIDGNWLSDPDEGVHVCGWPGPLHTEMEVYKERTYYFAKHEILGKGEKCGVEGMRSAMQVVASKPEFSRFTGEEIENMRSHLVKKRPVRRYCSQMKEAVDAQNQENSTTTSSAAMSSGHSTKDLRETQTTVVTDQVAPDEVIVTISNSDGSMAAQSPEPEPVNENCADRPPSIISATDLMSDIEVKHEVAPEGQLSEDISDQSASTSHSNGITCDQPESRARSITTEVEFISDTSGSTKRTATTTIESLREELLREEIKLCKLKQRREEEELEMQRKIHWIQLSSERIKYDNYVKMTGIQYYRPPS